MLRKVGRALKLAYVLALSGSLVGPVAAQMEHRGGEPGAPPSQETVRPKEAAPQAPYRITPEEVHRLGGTPKGWKFTLPAGDKAAGREIFVKMECYRCHAIEGEKFPATERKEADIGPPLTGMGTLHPAEYIAESIVNPNAVILIGDGFVGKDGRSIMPDYGHLLTVQDVIDLVGYLKSLIREEGKH